MRDWDEEYRRGTHWDEEVYEHMDRFLRLLKGDERVLEVGCGVGTNSAVIAENAGDVFAIDLSEEAIKRARGRNKTDNLHFSKEDVRDLDFEGGNFDVVFSVNSLCYVPSIEKASAEIYRVLKGGGIAFLSFLINKKSVEKGEIESYHPEKKIIETFEKAGFEVLEKGEFVSEDLEAGEPHVHDAFELVLRKA